MKFLIFLSSLLITTLSTCYAGTPTSCPAAPNGLTFITAKAAPYPNNPTKFDTVFCFYGKKTIPTNQRIYLKTQLNNSNHAWQTPPPHHIGLYTQCIKADPSQCKFIDFSGT